jgi:tetratricopeptide (TPR) repeat protein
VPIQSTKIEAMTEVILALSEAIKRAMLAFERGQLNEAVHLARAILNVQADHFDALHLIAMANAHQRLFDEALVNYDRALALRPNDAAALNNRGNTLNELKRFDEAAANYKRALAVRPDYAEALNNHGVALHALKRFEEALTNYERAVAARPNYARALYNRGVTLYELNRFNEALASYDRAIIVQPAYAEALHNRGITLHALRRFEEALASYEQALRARPGYIDAFYHRGVTLHTLARFDEALASYDRAIAEQPQHAEALSNRGIALHELKRFDEACVSYDRAIALQPEYSGALYNRGVTLHALKRFDEALASYDRAVEIRPDYAEAFNNRGNTLLEIKRFDEALLSLNRAIALRPNYAEACYNAGIALHALKRFDEALAIYDRALAARPEYAEALSNRGNTLLELARFHEALASYERAVAIRPDYAEGHWNMSLLLLLTGDYCAGWREYEWRWKNEGLGLVNRNFSRPLWLGESKIEGKTILLHSEQGFGDAIQFCRYVPLVVARRARVVLEVPAPLVGLMSSFDAVTHVISASDVRPHFDLHCPLLSLPLAFGTSVESIPADVPYLTAPSDRVRRWSLTLGPKRRLRIGLAWSGRPTHRNDLNRSINLGSLLPLLDLNADFVSLQRDVRPNDVEILKDRSDLMHFGDKLENFTDTAAVICNVDLVISVDTSVAHLAGALAKPVWILLPFVADWRWLLQREESPWYPTARLIRQTSPRNWSDVIGRVVVELRQLLAGSA